MLQQGHGGLHFRQIDFVDQGIVGHFRGQALHFRKRRAGIAAQGESQGCVGNSRRGMVERQPMAGGIAGRRTVRDQGIVQRFDRIDSARGIGQVLLLGSLRRHAPTAGRRHASCPWKSKSVPRPSFHVKTVGTDGSPLHVLLPVRPIGQEIVRHCVAVVVGVVAAALVHRFFQVALAFLQAVHANERTGQHCWRRHCSTWQFPRSSGSRRGPVP